jgi:hypothetical protein
VSHIAKQISFFAQKAASPIEHHTEHLVETWQRRWRQVDYVSKPHARK